MDREERIEELEGDLPSELAEKLVDAEDEIETWKAKASRPCGNCGWKWVK